jgi:hypothetical protein
MAMGVCAGIGGNILSDAFGIVSIVAVMPIVVVQIFGLVYGIKSKQAERLLSAAETANAELQSAAARRGEVITFPEVYVYG